MYVCICNGHRSSDIREAAETGLSTPHEIYAHLGKPVRCGQCVEFAAKLIDDVHAKQAGCCGASQALSQAPRHEDRA